jgi:PKD repeat protein
MTFTRASALPSPGTITASATNGFGPLTVVFTNTASGGGITNWVWNFGNGTMITNTTAANVTNTYATAGSYTVTLTVYNPGGSSSVTVANFIVASPTPKVTLTAANGQIVLSGTNCPAGVQYRFLTSSNLLTVLSNWKPIFTNTFGSNGTFAYTNTIGKTNSFFILVSP